MSKKSKLPQPKLSQETKNAGFLTIAVFGTPATGTKPATTNSHSDNDNEALWHLIAADLYIAENNFKAADKHFKAAALLGSKIALEELFLYKRKTAGEMSPRDYYTVGRAKERIANLIVKDPTEATKYPKTAGEYLKEAAKYYRLAAEKGYDFACLHLGHYYARNNSPEKNLEESLKWLEKAAERKAPLLNYIGVIYELVLKNMGKAKEYYTKAADEGHPYAHQRLATYYDKQEPNPIKNAAHLQKAKYGFKKLLKILQILPEECSLRDAIQTSYDEVQKLYAAIETQLENSPPTAPRSKPKKKKNKNKQNKKPNPPQLSSPSPATAPTASELLTTEATAAEPIQSTSSIADVSPPTNTSNIDAPNLNKIAASPSQIAQVPPTLPEGKNSITELSNIRITPTVETETLTVAIHPAKNRQRPTDKNESAKTLKSTTNTKNPIAASATTNNTISTVTAIPTPARSSAAFTKVSTRGRVAAKQTANTSSTYGRIQTALSSTQSVTNETKSVVTSAMASSAMTPNLATTAAMVAIPSVIQDVAPVSNIEIQATVTMPTISPDLDNTVAASSDVVPFVAPAVATQVQMPIISPIAIEAGQDTSAATFSDEPDINSAPSITASYQAPAYPVPPVPMAYPQPLPAQNIFPALPMMPFYLPVVPLAGLVTPIPGGGAVVTHSTFIPPPPPPLLHPQLYGMPSHPHSNPAYVGPPMPPTQPAFIYPSFFPMSSYQQPGYPQTPNANIAQSQNLNDEGYDNNTYP